MTVDTTELRRLARNATKGPWVRVFSDKKTVKQFKTISGGDVTWIADCLCPGAGLSERVAAEYVDERGDSNFADVEVDHWRAGADATFIAAANPATVLALLDKLDGTESMFLAACADLGAINKLLGLDPDDGGAEPILYEVKRLLAIEAAARNLAKVKGRHHAEIAMNRLQATLAASE